MGNDFNKKIMLDNITYALKEFGKRIGEFESEIGVSAGYISRTSKDENAKPGIDFVVNAADALNMSVDTLINVDLSALTPTEKYYVDFMEKLISDSLKDKLFWVKDTANELNSLEINQYHDTGHPLFDLRNFTLPGEEGYPEEHNEVVFVSNTFEFNTWISKDCFSLRLKNGTMLYLMNIRKAICRTNDTNATAREMWIYKPNVGPRFMCSDRDEKLGSVVERLFETVEERYNHPQLEPELKSVIDAFMVDDLADDPVNYNTDDDIPF